MAISTQWLDEEPAAWELAELDADTGLPDEIPDWVLTDAFGEHLDPHECACCTEPDADLTPEPVRWAIPGLWDTPPTVSGPSPQVLALQAALTAIAAVDPGSLSPTQALADTEALLALQHSLRVHLVRRTADVDDRDLYALAGARTTRSWLKGLQPDADASDVSFARTCRHFRFLQTAVESGDLAINAAKAVVSALGRCGRHVDNRDGLIDGQPADQVIPAVVRNVIALICSARMGLDDDDPLLTQVTAATELILSEGGSELEQLEKAFTLLARHVPLRMLKPMLEELFLAIVPSELDRLNDQTDAGSSITRKQRPDGRGARWIIDPSVELDERMLVGLHAEMRRDADNPLDTAAAAAMREQGLDPHNPDHYPLAQSPRDAFSDTDGRVDDAPFHPDFGAPRGRAKRMHDAFNQMLGRYLDQGLAGTHHKTPVQINVGCTDARVTGQPGGACQIVCV